MNNKDKKPKKKKKAAAPKKEVKRPAHKKPRAKKHVEAKIPQLPPAPTAVVEAKEAPTQLFSPIEVEVKPMTPHVMAWPACNKTTEKKGFFNWLRRFFS